MRSIPWRVQLAIVSAAYAAAVLLAVFLVVVRYMQYAENPGGAAAAGGMYAGGDLLLGLFIVCMFFVPTFLLMLVIRKSEAAYTRYSQVLFGISLTALVCFALMFPISAGAFGWVAMCRLLVSLPLLIVLMLSWLFARFPRAKRLILYALLFEAGSNGIVIAMLMGGWAHH
jgi:hypothetical protein